MEPNGNRPNEPMDQVDGGVGSHHVDDEDGRETGTEASVLQAADLGDWDAGRAYGRGRFLRAVAGCDESILRACPEERFRFSGFGAVILGTACLAAVSMTFGLSIVFDESLWKVAPVGLLWGTFILAFDRWLVSSGTGWRHFLPRILLAGFFGVIIAEPIVLLAFDDAVMEHINEDIESEVAERRALLTRCNPVIEDALDPVVTVDGCEDGQLPLERPANPEIPEASEGQVAHQSNLQSQLDSLNARLETQRSARPAEVAGDVGDGLSGRAGDGPAAAARQEAINGLLADIDRVSGELEAIDAEIAEIEGQGQTAREKAQAAASDYNEALAPAIRAEVAKLENQLSATPGLARRMDTLSNLMGESHTILLARIALTLFFVAIDTAPAFVRVTSSGSAYDKILLHRMGRTIESEQVRRRLEADRRQTHHRVERARIEHKAEEIERELAFKRQLDEARIDQETEDAIAQMAQSELMDTPRHY